MRFERDCNGFSANQGTGSGTKANWIQVMFLLITKLPCPYLTKFPPEKHSVIKMPRNHIPYRGNPSIYYFPVSPLKCAQGSCQIESHEAVTASILNRTGACAIFHYRTFPACQILSQYNSRRALSLQTIMWLWKPSLLRWFLPLFTNEACSYVSWNSPAVGKTRANHCKIYNEKKTPWLETQT